MVAMMTTATFVHRVAVRALLSRQRRRVETDVGEKSRSDVRTVDRGRFYRSSRFIYVLLIFVFFFFFVSSYKRCPCNFVLGIVRLIAIKYLPFLSNRARNRFWLIAKRTESTILPSQLIMSYKSSRSRPEKHSKRRNFKHFDIITFSEMLDANSNEVRNTCVRHECEVSTNSYWF